MELKPSLFILLVLLGASDCGLLRTPKVYNALITSNDNLTPSRAYPVIQPTLHETGLAYPQFPLSGYGSFGVFDPFSQSLLQNAGRSYPRFDLKPQETNEPQEISSFAAHQPDQPVEIDVRTQELPKEIAADQNSSEKQEGTVEKPAEQSQIPLNEFGLPPSLVPLSSYGNQQQPVPLQPYPYSTYPLIYDQFGGFQTGPYLPPYGYYPQPGFGYPTKQKNVQPLMKQVENNRMEKELVSPVAPLTVDPESIKNHPNKNKNIPDVPPPPIPTGKRTAAAATTSK